MSMYDGISDMPTFLKWFGNVIAMSKVFGAITPIQGELLAMECVGRQCSAMSLAERYHYMHGKLAMKYQTMLGDFRAKLGGDYKVVERSENAAEIVLTRNGTSSQFRFTWDDAQREPFVYEGKEAEVLKLLATGKKPALNSNYQTPRSRMQFLFARVVSDGVHVMGPEVTNGACTPEEVTDFDEFKSNGENGKGKQKWTTSAAAATVTAEEPKSTYVVADATPSEPQYCTGDQVVKITELLGFLNPTEADIEAMKQRRGVNAWRQMTVVQADELIGKLKTLFDQRASATAAAATATAEVKPQATVAINNDPATEEQVTRAKQLIVEIEQSSAGFTARLGAKLKESGLNRLVDLTVSELDNLIQQLGVKNLEAFFTASLEGHAKFRPTTAETAAKQTPY